MDQTQNLMSSGSEMPCPFPPTELTLPLFTPTDSSNPLTGRIQDSGALTITLVGAKTFQPMRAQGLNLLIYFATIYTWTFSKAAVSIGNKIILKTTPSIPLGKDLKEWPIYTILSL